MPSATDIGKILVQTDTAIALTGASASTTTGAAQTKKTATNLLLTVYAQPVGGVAVAGSFLYTLIGANTSNAALASWTSVTPDKGSLTVSTAQGAQVVHCAQLQFQFYRLFVSQGATSTAQILDHFAFLPTEDSFDATVQ